MAANFHNYKYTINISNHVAKLLVISVCTNRRILIIGNLSKIEADIIVKIINIYKLK